MPIKLVRFEDTDTIEILLVFRCIMSTLTGLYRSQENPKLLRNLLKFNGRVVMITLGVLETYSCIIVSFLFMILIRRFIDSSYRF
jgi:hypothetical protein